MTSSKSTKRALISSALAILMCVAMLIGTTFAWFTDTASTGVNKIVSGNLKVDIIGADSEDHIEKLNFTKAATTDEEAGAEILWEPGCRYLTEGFRIANKGNLALKWKAQVNKGTTAANAGNFDLLDVIDFYLVTSKDVGDMGTELNEFSGNLKTTETSDVYYIKGVMKTTAGNDYQGLTLDGISITVVATQDTVENDSFGNQYDKDATYPVIVSNQQQANDAITNATDKKVNISIAPGQTITLDNGIANEGDKSRDITFSGDGSQTVDVITNAISAEGGQLNYQRGSSFTFENLTIQAGEGNFDGIVCNELTFKDCTIKGKLTLFGKATFINCVFENTMANQYSIWTWGGTDVTFENCTFNTNGKAILLYGGATASNPTNLVVNNCTFNDRNSGTAGKAAIEIGNDYNATYTLTVNNATVNGFAAGKNTGSTLWANKNSMDAAHLTVTIDGSKVQ